MNVIETQNSRDVRFSYEAPDVSITVFSATDVICASTDVGEEYPRDDWFDQ